MGIEPAASAVPLTANAMSREGERNLSFLGGHLQEIERFFGKL